MSDGTSDLSGDTSNGRNAVGSAPGQPLINVNQTIGNEVTST